MEMSESEGCESESTVLSPERKKVSTSSNSVRGTSKRGQGRRQNQKFSIENDTSQNGGQQVACLKHVGKFRYLSKLTQAESTESETTKAITSRGKRGNGRGRGRGRGSASVKASTPIVVTEPSNHVSSRGRRIKPNSRWAPDADFEPSPPRPVRGTRRSAVKGAKRSLKDDIDHDSASSATGNEDSINVKEKACNIPNEDHPDACIKLDDQSKTNGEIEDPEETVLTEKSVQLEISSSDECLESNNTKHIQQSNEPLNTVEIFHEEDATVVEVESETVILDSEVDSKENAQDSPIKAPSSPLDNATDEHLSINDGISSSVPNNEHIETEKDLSLSTEVGKIESPAHQSVNYCDDFKPDNSNTDKENSTSSETHDPTPEYSISSASNTPKHDDEVDSQFLPSPKPVKVKSRWRRTSELEQVHGRNKPTEAASNDGSHFATIEGFDSSNTELIGKTNGGLDNSSSLDDKILIEERLSSFEVMEENRYLTSRKTSKEVKRMLCDCTLTKEEIARGELGCEEDCINRLLMIECGSRCQLGERCTNKRFQKREYAKLEVVNTGKKGVGLRAIQDLNPGDFIIEYVGEVIDPREFHKRAKEYARDKNKHYYFMALKSDAIIDATLQGNISRFINHSCDPNAETQKWTVNGDLRVGFFVRKHIRAGEEITFDYQFQRYGKEAQRCYCESENCRGWIGEDPEKEDKGREKKERKEKKRKAVFRDEVNTIDLESEIDKLVLSGVKNRAQTLTLSRLMVRAEDLDTRKNILGILRNAEQPCRRLFLDYHGLKLLWGWMVDASSAGNSLDCLQFKLDLLSTLSSLPVPNKTMLLDSKVLSLVEKWTNTIETASEPIKTDLSENDESVEKLLPDTNAQVVSLAAQLIDSWSQLKEVFRIPKKERIEEMKEHEREADRDRNENSSEPADEQVFKLSSYDRRPTNYVQLKEKDKLKRSRESPERENRKIPRIEMDPLTKEERRRLFALKVAQQEEELRVRKNQEDVWRRQLGQCLMFPFETSVTPGSLEAPAFVAPTSPFTTLSGTHSQVFWDPVMGSWQPSAEDNLPILSNPVLTPLSETGSAAIVKVPSEPPLLHLIIPKGYDPTSMGPLVMDFDACEYEASGIPYVPACLVVQHKNEEISQDAKLDTSMPPEKSPVKLPRFWRQATDNRGRNYYYHVKIRLPQWEPPTPDGETPDFSSEDDEELVPPSESVSSSEPPVISIPENPIEDNRTKRKSLLCKEKVISPRSDFERSADAQRYRELKERLLRYKLARIRERGLWVDEAKVDPKVKHKDRDRRRHTEREKEKLRKRAKEKHKRTLHKAENKKKAKDIPSIDTSFSADSALDSASLIDGNENTAEKELADASLDDDILNTGEVEDETAEFERNKDVSANTVRKIKDAFRMKISSDIVNILNPYRRPDCKLGRITCTDDFKHLARKMTHFVLAKELKHCRNIEDLVVNDSVKHKAKDFIKKYMMKFGPAYKRGNDDET